MSCLIGLVMFAYYQKYPMSAQQSQAAPDQVRRPFWPLLCPGGADQGPLRGVSGWLQKGLAPWGRVSGFNFFSFWDSVDLDVRTLALSTPPSPNHIALTLLGVHHLVP